MCLSTAQNVVGHCHELEKFGFKVSEEGLTSLPCWATIIPWKTFNGTFYGRYITSKNVAQFSTDFLVMRWTLLESAGLVLPCQRVRLARETQ